ncbi:MAG: Crp/Fnr family transcriptional regulator [Arenimonas sp.]
MSAARNLANREASPARNRLLGALPPADLERIGAQLEPVQLLVGDLLCDSGASMSHAIFPASAIVSLQYVMENGASAEFAGVGNEGMVGIALVTGGESMPSRAVVQAGGLAYRLRASLLQAEFERGGALSRLLLLYLQALVSQVALGATCNRRHTLEQQLCRWFLFALDRVPGNELRITQELIASMLGVRREGVTEAAGRLQRAGIIEYRRGHITVLRRAGLVTRSCECYEVARRELDRLLPQASVATAHA